MIRSRLCIAVASLVLTVTGAAAQDAALDEIERLAAAGRLSDARAALDDWNRRHPESAALSGAVRAQALLLGARLAPDPATAEAGYLAVALGYPTSAHAPEALLRLGQGMVAAAEWANRADGAARATGYLDRLVNDYPGSPHRAAGLLWLTRAHLLAGRRDRGCAVARDNLATGLADPDVEDMLRIEFAQRCDGPVPDRRATPPRPVPAASAASGDYTIQSAALSDRDRADALARRLRDAGFDARVVSIQGSRLVRVRVGRYPDVAAADRIAANMRAAGFEAVVVGDVKDERVR